MTLPPGLEAFRKHAELTLLDDEYQDLNQLLTLTVMLAGALDPFSKLESGDGKRSETDYWYLRLGDIRDARAALDKYREFGT